MLATFCYTVLTIWIWEYIGIRCRRCNYPFLSPTTILNAITKVAKYCFNRLGRLLAYISSFYVYLRVEDFFMAGWDVLNSIRKLILSGFELIRGYYSISFTFHRFYLIYLGTITLVVGLLIGVFYRFGFNLTGWDVICYTVIVIVLGVILCFGHGWYYHRYGVATKSDQVESETSTSTTD